jgi:hypothetical protein
MRARVVYSLLVLWALALPTLAQDRGRPSLDRVLPEIRRSTPGTFYDAQGPFVGPNGQAAYRIKWMTPDGRIIWFYADARTGQVMGMVPRLPQPDRFRDGYPGQFRDGWPPRDDGDRWRRGNGEWNGGGDGDRNGRGGNWGGDRGDDRGGNRGGHGRRPGG